jgi:outer membrane lipopolysaccharide assembly protein LptE/RlpB
LFPEPVIGRTPPSRWLSALLGAVLLLGSGCGYHVAGRAARLPESWKTIAVPALANRTPRYRIEQRLTDATIRELLSRTSYRIIQDENAADAVLHGEVISIQASPVLFDPVSGQVTTLVITVDTSVRLVDRLTKRVVYQNNNFVFREEYQVTTDVNSFFEEQNPALKRLARDFAARLVSGILENF